MRGAQNKLSAARVAKAATPGYLLDGGGLYLQVTLRASGTNQQPRQTPMASVSKSWCFRYRDRTTHKLRELGLGSYPDISLELARQKASELRLMLEDRKDPKAERDAKRMAEKAEEAKAMTFDEAAAACIAAKRGEWRNQKHADQWANTLGTYVSPLIGSLPVMSIDRALVASVLKPIWDTKNETASRVRQRIETVLAWAAVHNDLKVDNPARWKGNLSILFSKPSKVQNREHHAALPYQEVGAFVASLRTSSGLAALALEFTILTAARTGEVIAACWDEVDLQKGIWVVPAERMKARKEHTVPLSRRALEILKGLSKAKASPFVFPGLKKGEALSNMAMIALLKRMNRTDITVHGFRSTFRDWAGEQTNFPREVIEHALAHQLKDKAEAAYHRSTMPEKRRKMMEAWAIYCSSHAASASQPPRATKIVEPKSKAQARKNSKPRGSVKTRG